MYIGDCDANVELSCAAAVKHNAIRNKITIAFLIATRRALGGGVSSKFLATVGGFLGLNRASQALDMRADPISHNLARLVLEELQTVSCPRLHRDPQPRR